MATQLEKQLGVTPGKYSNSELARMKNAKEESRSAFRKAKKSIDAGKKSGEVSNTKPKARPQSASKSASGSSKESAPKVTKNPRPKARPTGVKTTSVMPQPMKAPSQSKSPSTPKSSGVKVGGKGDKSPANRAAPAKAGRSKPESKFERDRPSSRRMGRKISKAQYDKMTRAEKDRVDVRHSKAGRALEYWLLPLFGKGEGSK